MLPAAIAAVVMLLVGGTIVVQMVRNYEYNRRLAQNSGDNSGLPAVLPDPEERAFHFAALKRLVDGEFGMQGEEYPAADTPPTELPPLAVAAPATDPGTIASAITGEDPFFDVPLSPETDPSR